MRSVKQTFIGKKKQTRLAMLFLLPWIIGFLAFYLYPMLMTLYYSFTDYSFFKAPNFLGFDNYKEMLADKRVIKSFFNSLYMVVFCLGLQLILAMFTASLLNAKIKAKSMFRIMCYLPSLVPPVASSLIWVWMLNPQNGLVNVILRLFNLQEPLWFFSVEWSKPAIVLIMLWGIGNTMIIYLAGIGDIPPIYYEAMDIDGGNAWQKFWKITWPMLTPVTLFQLIIGIIASFNMFTQGYIVSLTQGRSAANIGGKADSLLFWATNIHYQCFEGMRFGYASALSWTMLIFVWLLTFTLLKSSKHWVFYGGEK